MHVVVRIVTSDDGVVRQIVAGQKGKPGCVDGASVVSQLKNPSSLALSRDSKALLICDDGNAAVRSLDIATHKLSTLTGNSRERIRKTWMPPGEGLAPSLRCPGGSVSIVKTLREAIWSTAFAPLPQAPEGGDDNRRSWCVVVNKKSRFSVRVGVARLVRSVQVCAHVFGALFFSHFLFLCLVRE